MTPTDSQAAAIAQIVDWYKGGKRTPQVFYLAGYAGVGKSEVARMAIEELKDKCKVKTICSAAYTGKAAQVLRMKGVEGAMTFHSATYIPVEGEGGRVTYQLAWGGPAASADLIVLDEVSFISEADAKDLMLFGKKILVMGDPGQLPPVKGQGAFTNRTPDAFLTEIHRQAADSPIIRLATLAREGKPIPVGDYGDGVRVDVLTPDTQEAIYREETQAICGIHRVRWGYTQRIRRIRGFDDPLPQVGERLICRRNNKAHAIFNGGLGELIKPVETVVDGFVNLSVQMDDLDRPSMKLWTNPYLFEQHFKGATEKPEYLKGCNEFDWGNVLTCHSAQGSEYEDVTLIDDSGAFREDRHKWAYTGLTRASKRLVFLKRAA